MDVFSQTCIQTKMGKLQHYGALIVFKQSKSIVSSLNSIAHAVVLSSMKLSLTSTNIEFKV